MDRSGSQRQKGVLILPIVTNLQRERRKWSRLTRVLIREGAYAQASGHIYLVVVQSVMIYELETWVITLRIGRVLGDLHHRNGVPQENIEDKVTAAS